MRVNKFRIKLNQSKQMKELEINQYNRNIPFLFEVFDVDDSPYVFQANDIIKIEMALLNQAIIVSEGFEIENNNVKFMLDRAIALNSGSGRFNFVIENETNNSRLSSKSIRVNINSNAIDEKTVPEKLLITVMEKLQALITNASEIYNQVNLALYIKKTEAKSTYVEKEIGKKLMLDTDKDKLDGIAENANNYTHPDSHPASIITEDANKRFVSDLEKSNWDAAKGVTDKFVTTASSIELPGGLLLQRGIATVNLKGSTSNNAVTVVFDKPFKAGTYSIVACNDDELNIAYNVNVNVKQIDGASALVSASVVKGTVDSIVKANWIAYGEKVLEV